MTENIRSFSRREFLIQTALGAAGLFALDGLRMGGLSQIVGANDRFRVGVVGLGEKGIDQIKRFISLPNVQIAAVCDTDESRFAGIDTILRQAGHPTPTLVTDHRLFTEIDNLDAVSLAVPVATRTDMALDFCDAGKGIMIERPFSTTARDGKRLVDAAEAARRVVQQRDDTFLIAVAEAPSLVMAKLGRIESVKGWKSVSDVSYKHPESFFENMTDEAWTDLDLIRCVVGGEIPNHLAARSAGRSNPGAERIGLDIEFQDVRIEFEVMRRGLSGASESRFSGKNGSLRISANASQNEAAKLASFMNFVDCVKEGGSKGLINPISEARKSNFLIELAKKSLATESRLTIDPTTEVVSSANLS